MAFPINNGRPARGFTLIELLVVMSIIGALMALVSPSYFKNNDRARETVLRHNLAVLRQAMDDYRADHGANPSALQDLVSNRYLRELPLDPILGQRDGWQTRSAEDGGIGEVSSGAKGAGLDGSDYGSW
ncbi:type II secretion system protein [Chromobacterium sp.]|uniref:type II secretion system protein n=1 Tax=Chromobacterium sp. TaxID=306190 RepID=UPI0035B14838